MIKFVVAHKVSDGFAFKSGFVILLFVVAHKVCDWFWF